MKRYRDPLFAEAPRKHTTLVFLVMALSNGICAFLAWRSHRAIGKPLAALLAALIPPVIGNLIIISTGRYELAIVGCYVYYLGMDLVLLGLLWMLMRRLIRNDRIGAPKTGL